MVTIPGFSIESTEPLETRADVLVFAVGKSSEGPVLLADGAGVEPLAAAVASIGISGGADEVRRIPAIIGSAASIVLVGTGTTTPDANAWRRVAGSVTRQVRGVERIAFALPLEDRASLVAALEGAAIGAYAFDEYRSAPSVKRAPAREIVMHVRSDLVDMSAVDAAAATASAIHLVRDLVNTPPSDLYPETFADRAVEAVAEAASAGLPITTTVLTERELAEGGFGGILGVGQGSVRPPRLVTVDYHPEGATQHLALVGKGITFDSGGLSLKPATGMVGMKYDMTGAATVLSAAIAIAKLRLPIRVTAWLCIAENMPSGTATRPNDVITIRGGTTVEVLNTDAEGRLVLADGLVRASEERPDAIIDVATLTGAARQAFGGRIVAAMGDEQLTDRIISASKVAGESFWPVPLPDDFRSQLESDVADIANVKLGAPGGMIIAGIFLQEFVGRVAEGANAPRIPWTHLDIAGPANNDGGGHGYTASGPTGVTLRTIVELASSLAAQPLETSARDSRE